MKKLEKKAKKPTHVETSKRERNSSRNHPRSLHFFFYAISNGFTCLSPSPRKQCYCRYSFCYHLFFFSGWACWFLQASTQRHTQMFVSFSFALLFPKKKPEKRRWADVCWLESKKKLLSAQSRVAINTYTETWNDHAYTFIEGILLPYFYCLFSKKLFFFCRFPIDGSLIVSFRFFILSFRSRE